MKRKLHLIRHSYAENPTNSQSDIDRRLTLEGQTTIRALGRYLSNQGFDPSKILCSTAARTRETAINLLEELDLSERIVDYLEVIYNASLRELLALVNACDGGHKEIAIIGHNPAITFFGEYLTGAAIGNMQPSSIVSVEFDNMKR